MYKVISAKSIEHLEEEVIAAQQEGWKLQGGAVISEGESFFRCYQTIVKEKTGETTKGE
jgi:hypothetical protein